MSRLLLAMCLMGGCAALFAGEGQDEQRLNAAKLMQQGNWKDAFGLFSKLAADAKGDPQKVGEDLAQAGQCLMRLGRYNEFDELREKCIEIHARNWKLLQAAAQTISDDPHYGYIVAGKFHRLNHRGGGQYVMSVERDRARALQLMTQALELIKAEPDKVAAGTFYLRFSEMLQRSGNTDAWRLQYLTDLKTLPDYEEGYGYRGRGRWGHGGEVRGAPVGADGNPVYYTVPKSFEAAQNDGERWRWTLAMAAEMNPQNTSTVRMRFAAFLQQQFDVRSMAGFGRVSATSGDKEESGPYAVSTLGEDETIAKLATGIKRFKLPDEFNFIKMYQGIAAEFKGQNDAKNAIEALAGIFEDRQQYPKAAEYWKRSIAEYPNGSENARHRLSQITGNWGQFEPVMMQPAGKNATIEFRFRNANKVSFTAQEIEVKKLLDDTKAYLKAGPKQIDWQRLDVSNIGYKLVQQNQQQYVGKQVAQWEQALDPRDKHFDRRTTITTPLQKSGAYLLTAQIPDGNASRIIIWLSDTAIVKKQLDKQAMYYVADSVTGQPLNGLEVEFFGYQQRHIKDNNWQVDTKQFVQASDADGQIRPTQEIMPNNMQWIATANTADGRFAYLGFTNVWYGNYYQPEYQQNKAFIITDRPAYRPNQPVKFKVWLGQAKYDHEGKSPFANTRVTLLINNPKGEKILEKDFETDEYGGFDSELTLDKEATLGAYSINVKNWWPGATFRLEEYKKPEFEVKIDAPNEPVMLGEKITAKITSKYYFGAPVTDAKVKYKVMRSSYSANWYPAARWDWFYNGGYWWFGGDYAWYPGFAAWGCKRPYPWWYGARNEQPELVIENEVPIEPDGTVKVEIDTAVAKAVHADTDHKYEITAEVTDQSRRTIVGSGSVMVARSPYRVYAWVDRGHYRVGDVIKADFSAQTLDNKPVQGKGKLKLLKIAYDKDSQPVETQVQEWAIDTDAQGKAQQQMKADQPGQYRISYSVSDAKNHTIEGGYLFVVMGEGFDGSQFRFNNIELVTDKREYKPGEKVQLMINSNRAGGTVLLFTRPSNGVYLPPKVIRLKGKSTIEEIEIHRKDMPNFFLEALTISDGKLFSEVREVIVPPENKVLDVAVVPSANQYKPGEKAKIQLKLTDPSGEPYSGSAVVSVYDKSIEYISGGSNVPEIRSHFWKWRRNHYEQNFHNLSPYSSHLLKPNEIGMQFLGAFGYLTAELDSLAARTAGAKQERRGAGEGEYRYRQLKSDAPGAPPAPTAAAANAMDAGGGAFGLREAGKKEKAAADKDRGAEELEQQNAQSAPDVEPTVRSNFADSAYWAAKIVTAANGIAEIEVPMPENLTTWKIKVWSMGQGTRVGQGEAEIITSKNLIVRLQAPRFVTERDEVVLSANVHNYLKNKKNVRVELEVDSGTLQAGANTKQSVDVDATGEKRVDWRVKVLASGQPKVRVRAITDEESDAMEMTFPSYVHGMVKTESVAGAMRPDKNSASFTVNVPAQRRETDSRLEVRYSPTLAGAMVDALPYLVDYPYGCTEQTLSRFLPTVITQKVLNRMNINLKEVQGKVTNLNAQEIGDDVARSKQWQRHKINPVFDEEEVGRMVRSGVDRLVSMQCTDGGWGWFSGMGERSYPHTTAYVVHGLQTAKVNGIAVPQGVLERGVQWLKAHQDAEIVRIRNAPLKINPSKAHADNQDAFNFMVLTDAKLQDKDMLEFLYRDRNQLAVYGKAMLGLALHKLGEKEKLAMVLQNIEQFLVQDEENQTAYLKMPEENQWWNWYGSEYEAQAYYLKLLAATDPKSEKASRLVKYLINNRKNATYWNSTRDTAVCIEAMAEYLTASGEDSPDMKLEILVNGQKAKEVSISASNLFTFDNKLVLAGNKLGTGEQKIELKKTGRGPLYFNAYMTNFTLEDDIKKTGLEVKVERKYYKLTRVEAAGKVQGARGQALDQKIEKYERKPLANLDTLKSGDLVEIELEIESKNDYEYILFEDMKAAGFEPFDVRSGYNGNSLGAYMELRDERVCLFVRQLARGKHSLSYRMRAEIPGKFSALPTRAYGMYAPELRANSDEIKLNIAD